MHGGVGKVLTHMQSQNAIKHTAIDCVNTVEFTKGSALHTKALPSVTKSMSHNKSLLIRCLSVTSVQTLSRN